MSFLNPCTSQPTGTNPTNAINAGSNINAPIFEPVPSHPVHPPAFVHNPPPGVQQQQQQQQAPIRENKRVSRAIKITDPETGVEIKADDNKPRTPLLPTDEQKGSRSRQHSESSTKPAPTSQIEKPIDRKPLQPQSPPPQPSAAPPVETEPQEPPPSTTEKPAKSTEEQKSEVGI